MDGENRPEVGDELRVGTGEQIERINKLLEMTNGNDDNEMFSLAKTWAREWFGIQECVGYQDIYIQKSFLMYHLVRIKIDLYMKLGKIEKGIF
jgi:hypothetical protein